MEKLQALMSRKIYGIPVLAFVVLFGAGLLYMAIRMKPAPESVTTEGDAPEGDGDPLSGDTSQPVFRATPTIMQPTGTSGGSVTGTPMEDSNALWGRRATEWLISEGTTIDMATRVINKYLDGQSLTTEEAKVRDKAVTKYGLPPEAVPYAPIVDAATDTDTAGKPPFGYDPNKGRGTGTDDGGWTPADIYTPTDTTPPPVTAPPAGPIVVPPASKQGEPPCDHVVQSTRDNTMSDLALLYYGSRNVDLVQRIRSREANQGISEPMSKGTRVRIPTPEPKWFVTTNAVKGKGDIAAKNGITERQLVLLNPAQSWPTKPGTRVQVG